MSNNYSWTGAAWPSALPVFGRIINLQFIKELSDGTLPVEKFRSYIAQDELYLGNYGRQMFEFAAMVEDSGQRSMFEDFAKAGLEGERQMHDLLIDRFNITEAPCPSPVTKAYNEHTQQGIDSGNKAIALAALLPCMWVYNEVGLHIRKTAQLDGNPYREWIEEYGNEEFTAGVQSVLKLADSYALESSGQVREEMTRYYVEGTELERRFWEWSYLNF